MSPLGETGPDAQAGGTPPQGPRAGPSRTRRAPGPASGRVGAAGRDPTISIAHAAMQSLLGHRISPSPENYLVWFSYHAGTHPGLREVVDARQAEPGGLQQGDLDELHAAFCAGEPQAVAIGLVSRQLEAALTDAAGMLGTAQEDAARYGTRLEGLTDTLVAAGPTLNDALRRILADTQVLCRNSRSLAQRLAERAREAETLRGALREARTAAATDALTGLPNRRAFEERLTEAMAPGPEEASPLCLIMFDIDHFKSVNDRYGHPAGDAVLCGLANTLREWARPADRLARVGGEEFAVILPATSPEEAIPLADALRRAVARDGFLAGANGERLSVTISLGVALRQPGETGETLMGRADTALYEAKRQGRDRVVLDFRDQDGGPAAPTPEKKQRSWR